MIRLPPFSGLIAFYASVRHGTLTGAARELNVSQPAVSRRIAALERDLGAYLFDRSHKPARLTQQGRDLMRALRAGFDQIETATEQIRRSDGKQVITVAGPSGFVGFWLIPRLGELEAAFPNINIRIISQEHGHPERPADVNIRFGRPSEAGHQETRILGNEVYPVASPLYLQNQPEPLDLLRMTLLTMEAARTDWHDWPSWFDSIGSRLPAEARTHDFNSYAMLVNAVLAGRGVCLCWSGLLDSFLDAGSLVRLDGPTATTGRGYFLTCRDSSSSGSDISSVRDWIVSAAPQT